jgi:peptidoglycan-N-acetylglucosamine deacetylase
MTARGRFPMNGRRTAGEKRIAFTFDDAPRPAGGFFSTPERTARLIAGLRSAAVRQAAFFVTVGNLQELLDDGGASPLEGYAAAGHVLGNHSFRHLPLSATPVGTYLTDIDRATAWIGSTPGYRPWFRFPYLDEGDGDHVKRGQVRAGLTDRGLVDAYVTVLSNDWYLDALAGRAHRDGVHLDMCALRDLHVERLLGAAEFYDRIAVTALERSPAHVLLLHDTDLNALFIADVATAFRSAGWDIVDVDEAYDDAIGSIEPVGPSGSGRAVTLALMNGVPLTELAYWPIETEELDRAFSERVLARGAGIRDQR